MALLLACGAPTTQSYQVEGQVLGIDPEGRVVKIAHEDIPGFMPAMTMTFDVATPALLEDVGPGARVRFTLERRATTLRIVALQVLEAGAPAGVGTLPGPPEEAYDFRLVDQQGHPLALSDLLGRAVLLDFIFTRCPGPCPILTSVHVALQRQLPEAIAERTHFVSISVDPAWDTPERLLEYASARGVDLAHWSFLTGDPARVEEVLRRYHIGTRRAEDGTLEHVVATFLIDPDGNIVRRYLGLEHPPEELLADLRELLS